MHDRPRCTLKGLIGSCDEFRPALYEHLNPHIFGNEIFGDQLSHEVKIGLACRGEPDFDLSETHLHQFSEHRQFAHRVHRINQGLIAITEVNRAPDRSLIDGLIRPGAVGKDDRYEWGVTIE